MRQRRIKNLDEKLKEVESFQIKVSDDGKGEKELKEYFSSPNAPLFLEIGCGKGQFLSCLAKDNPTNNYIAIEMQISVIYNAMAKAKEADIDNIKFIYFHLDNGNLLEMFGENQLDGIYLNFSDPWPKARHQKRRLTHRRKLLEYAKILKPGGFIEFKTDNDELFDFSLEEIESVSEDLAKEGTGFNLETAERDLHKTELDAKDYKTEYEEKFIIRGIPIKYIHIKITKS